MSELVTADKEIMEITESIVGKKNDQIHVGAGGRLHVEREDIEAGIIEGSMMDIAALRGPGIRRPNRHEWIVVDRESELTTHLLFHKARPEDVKEDIFYIDKSLRGPISQELKAVRMLRYYSLATKEISLWPIKVTLENSWYESVSALLKQPVTFFKENAIRVASDRDASEYRIRYLKLESGLPAWPAESMEEMLDKALGEDGLIASPDHPVYKNLVSGKELA